jgi:molybdopterin converting factor subunit 1
MMITILHLIEPLCAKPTQIGTALARRVASGYNFSMPAVSPNLRVRVLFFGRVRELTGLTEEATEVPEGATLANLFDTYTERFPRLAGFRASLVASRNEEFASWDTCLCTGDDVAFLPPVSGG